MIVLLSCSINSSSKNLSLLQGSSPDSVTVAVADLRKANSKLIQLSYEKDINSKLRQIVKNDSVLIEQTRQECVLLRRQSKKVKTQRNVAVGGAAAAIVLLILSLIK